MLTSETLAQP